MSRLRQILDKVGIWRIYLFRSHNQWTGIMLSLFNFSLIVFHLFFGTLFDIPTTIEFYLLWLAIFLGIYLPAAIFIGKKDMEKGTFKAGQKEWRKHDPIWLEINEKIDNITLELQKLTRD